MDSTSGFLVGVYNTHTPLVPHTHNTHTSPTIHPPHTPAHTHIHIHTPAHTTQFNAIVLSYELKYKFINLLYLIWSFILELIDDIL